MSAIRDHEPALTAKALTRAMARLRDAGPALRSVPLGDRVAVIDAVAGQWLARDSTWRRLAMAEIPRATGLPEEVLSLALDNLWNALRRPALEAALRDEWPAAPLHAPTTYGSDPLDAGTSPGLAFHSLAGNVPGVGVFGMVAALLTGVPSLVKTAAREPLLPVLAAQSIAERDARLGAGVAVLHWRGGDDQELGRIAISGADLTLAYGGDETLAALDCRTPKHILGYGSRVSLGIVTREAVDVRTARIAATQVALYDQRGCLSPQLLLLEESAPSATEGFAEALFSELRLLDVRWPRAPLTLVESASVWRMLEEQRWRAQEGHAIRILAGEENRFGVLCNRTGQPIASPLFRHLVVVPLRTLDEAASVLAPMRSFVEAVGFAGPLHRLDEASVLARQCGAHRLCSLDRLQAPPFSWRQSGHPRLAIFLPPGSETRSPAMLDPDLRGQS